VIKSQARCGSRCGRAQRFVVGLAIDEDEVGLDVAIAVIAPLAAERVIKIPPGQGLILCEHVHSVEKLGIEALPVPS